MIIAIDTETYHYNQSNNEYTPELNTQKFVLGCLKTDTGTTKFFDDHEEMYQYIIKTIKSRKNNKKKTYIYAHNMMYDWYAIAKDHLLDDNIKYISERPFIAICNSNGYILDTMAFYRMSLKRVGTILNLPKLEMPNKVTDINQLKPYLERDTQIVLEAILRIKTQITQLGYKPKRLLTAGQVAMTSFLTYIKRENIHKKIMVYNQDKKYMEIIKPRNPKKIRQAFRGGRTEAFQTGKFENTTLIDINAHYAHSMATLDFPYLQTEELIEQPENGTLQQILENNIAIIQCTIKAPQINIPYLPIRYASHTIYPSNITLKGTWTHIEIKRALQLGYKIEKIHWIIKYYKSETNPLKNFIEHLYKIEKQCKKYEEKLPIKLIRNNLYGKFSQNKTHKEHKIIPRYKAPEYIEKGYNITSTIEDKYIMSKETEPYEPSYTNPIISTLITAQARDILYTHLQKIPIYDLLYTDTDSIMYQGEHDHKYTYDREMGQFKKEAYGTAKILGEKRYYIDNKISLSGIPKANMSKNNIETETPITTQQMHTLLHAIKTGQLNKTGTFYQEQKDMSTHSKKDILLPEAINETRILDS